MWSTGLLWSHFTKQTERKKKNTIRFIRRHFVSRMIFYFKSNIELWLMTMLAKVENPCKNHLRCIHFERILCTIMSTSIEIHAFETISYFPWVVTHSNFIRTEIQTTSARVIFYYILVLVLFIWFSMDFFVLCSRKVSVGCDTNPSLQEFPVA